MARAITTVRQFKSVKPGQELADSLTPGLVLSVTPGGYRRWVFRYREPAPRDAEGNPILNARGKPRQGRLRKQVIGRFLPDESGPGLLTLEQAREAARELIGRRKQGVDVTPKPPEKTPDTPVLRTVREVREEYFEYLRHQRGSWKNDRNLLNKWMPEIMLDQDVKQVSPRHIEEVLAVPQQQDKPASAFALLIALGAMFRWSFRMEYVDTDPMARVIRKPAKPKARERSLSPTELGQFLRYIRDGKHEAVLRLLVLTGQRHAEVAEMEWSEVDLAEGKWTIPSERMKADRPHVVYLSKQALAIIQAQPRTSKWVFPRKSGGAAISRSVLGRHVAKVCEAMGCEKFVIHDLRRTLNTILAEDEKLMADGLILDQMLAHTKQGMMAVYNRATFPKQARRYWQHWANLCDKLEGPQLSVVSA